MKIAIVLLLSILTLLVGGVIVIGPRLARGFKIGTEPSGDPVRLQLVVSDEIIETVSAPGEIQPHTQVVIAAEVSARIEQLPFREGAIVNKGDLICKLDDEDLKAALRSSQARREGERFQLQAEQARHEGLMTTMRFARKQLVRNQKLFETGDISRKSLDDSDERVQDLESNLNAANYNISVLESSLTAADANIEQAEDALANTVIRAPIDGTITALNMEVGELVLGTFNNMGTAIMTIANLDRMLMKAQVAESDIASIEDGQQSKIFISAYPDDEFSGTVTHVALQRTRSTDGTGVFEVDIELDLQGQRIRSGHEANVDIQIATHQGLLVESQAIVERLIDDLPEELRRHHALVDRSRRTTRVVYTIVHGKAVCTPIKPGASDLTQTLVLEGLDPDSQVIIGPYKVLESIKNDDPIHDEDVIDEDDAGENGVEVDDLDETEDGQAVATAAGRAA